MNIDKSQIETNLRQHVDRLAGLIGARTLRRPKTIQATIGYIESQWAEMGYENTRETYDALGDEATNLIVEQTGTKRPDEIVLLGAHYDTVSTTPGADDNASAVAVLLEVGRLLKQHNCKRTIRYVAFACEEPPYFNLDAMGSQYHARQSRIRGDKIVGMLCLEMVGYYSTAIGSQAIPPKIPKWMHRFFPKRGDFLAAVGNIPSWKLCWNFRRGFKRGARKMPLFSICLPEKVNEIRLSDNSSFWDQGYPALMLTDPGHIFFDAGLGYWLYRSNAKSGLTGIVPTAEVHQTSSTQPGDLVSAGPFQVGNFSGSTSITSVVAGTTFEFGRRSQLTAGYATPIGGGSDRQYDGAFQFNFNRLLGP